MAAETIVIAGISIAITTIHAHYLHKKMGMESKKMNSKILHLSDSFSDFQGEFIEMGENKQIELLLELGFPLDELGWEFIVEHCEEMGVNEMSKEEILEMRWLWSDWEDCYDACFDGNPKWHGGGEFFSNDNILSDLTREQLIEYWKHHYYFKTVDDSYYIAAGYEQNQLEL